MKKKIFIALLMVVVIAVGFLRDYIFVSINSTTGQGPGGIGELFFWKWPLTIGFASLYFALTCLFLHLLFAQKKYADAHGQHTDRHRQYIRLAVFVYVVLVAVAFIAAAAGYLFSSFENVYPFVRTVMGIAQSPIVMMILIPACLLNESIRRTGEG